MRMVVETHGKTPGAADFALFSISCVMRRRRVLINLAGWELEFLGTALVTPTVCAMTHFLVHINRITAG